jgi:Butirosin biosynthesis protein H, N-terminal
MPMKAAAGSFARCSPLLPRVDSADLDCVCDNVALLLAHAGVEDVRTPFAIDWRFDLVAGSEGLPRLDLPPAALPELLAERTGFTLEWRPVGALDEAVADWRAALNRGEPVLVVGDAYDLPWVPYHGQKHLRHGFVVEGIEDGIAHVADAYDNVTQWGRAEPLATTLPVEDLAAALREGEWTLLRRVGTAAPVDVGERLAANAAAILVAEADGSYRRFLEAHREPDEPSLDNLTLQTWLLARNRALHGRWLGDQAAALAALGLADLPERFEAEIVAAWRRAAETSYMALRRVSAGRRPPPAAQAAAEAAAAAEPALAAELTHSSASPERI